LFDQLQIRAFEYPQGCLFESIISDEHIDADYQIKYKNIKIIIILVALILLKF
jgi:hypothetical protein